jgi:hypothetical protein
MSMPGFKRERGDNAAPFYPPWAGDSAASNAGFATWGPCGDKYQAPQIVVLSPQPGAPPPPPPPPEPARLVRHDYNWRAPANGDGNVFALVSRDGTVRFAIAVWL